jgi:F-type H+-transporting ATPase subunit delta
MKQSPQAAARRYARALLEVAQGDPARLREELEQSAALFEGNAELRRAMTHPGLGGERRQKLLQAIFASGSPVLQRVLALLAERGELALLPALAQAFRQAWNAQRGVLEADAAAAAALDDAQQKALAAALQGATGRPVELRTRVDAEMLGGLIVTMGGRTYDGSVRAQLQRLRRQLVQGTA